MEKRTAFNSFHEKGSKSKSDLTEKNQVSVLNVTNIAGLAHESIPQSSE